MTYQWLSALVAASVMVPAGVGAQDLGITVHGTAGAQLNSSGPNASVSVGFWPSDRFGLLTGLEWLHVPTSVTQYENGSSATRGGTSTFVSGEVRFVPSPARRVSPYVLAGVGFGRSRPNVNEHFPDPVDSFRSAALSTGGGVHIPISRHIAVSGDVRAVLQLEDSEAGVFLFVPARAGIMWRF